MRAERDEEFAEYVRARQRQLLQAAYLVCGDAHLADHLLQQALVKLALRWERLRGENPDGYVRRTLYRDAVSSWRKTRRENLQSIDVEPESFDERGRTDLRVDLMAALALLTPRQRAVLVLRFFEGRSEAVTAEVIGVSVGTVKSQTQAALARLREVVPDLVLSTEELA